ncbi:MAG: beta-lactamase family protein [Phyllobacteriaceae bacterium]|jgi:CubicO group peptidase (beta-lactamase class C family)|nr:beta-lactamase family protein [Phyllobacteriaceae bacterium]
MAKLMKIAGYGLALLVAAGAVTWYAIGPQWRMFLSNPPSDDRVLQWTQSQRDSGFALSDKLPIINSVRIEAGDTIRPLPQGEPLALDLDIDAYMESQNSAALVVLHNGQIRLERYGLHQDRDKRWTSFSVAKSLTSTLVGAAIADGHIGSLEDRVSDYVTALRGSAYDDVSIHQLLTMTSGVRWNEDYQDPQSDVALFNETEPEPGETALLSHLKRLPRAHPAGTVFNYSTGETNLVGILVASATGKTVSAYLSEKIWRPYGMQQYATWVTSKSGEEISGCCIQAAALDYARFGQFMLDGAIADGQPVVPDGWIEAATRLQVAVGREGVRDYGYQWWTFDDGAYMAGGIFGQAIFIDPSRELVIVTHSSWDDARGVSAGQNDERYGFFAAVQAAIDEEG